MRTQTQNLTNLPRMLNFVLGIILIFGSLIFMMTEYPFRPQAHIEPVLILMTGFISLMIAFSTKRMTGVRGNLFLGCFYLLTGLGLGVFLFNELEWFLTSVFGFTAQDIFLNIFLGVILLVLSYFYKNKNLYDSNSEREQLSA